jgi:hypothetical protein
MTYFTTSGPEDGPIMWRDGYGTIGVVGGLDEPRPIGTALEIGSDGDDVSLWRLTVHGRTLPGLWRVVGRSPSA